MAAEIYENRTIEQKSMRQFSRHVVSSVLALADSWLLRKFSGPLASPIFIVGVPRSGTTLLYQLLVYGFDVSYLSNRAYAFYRTPAIVTRLARSEFRKRRADFKSNYGRTSGPSAPNEGDKFWKRWFPKDDSSADETFVTAQGAHTLKRSVGALESILGGPFVSKHVAHSVRIRALVSVFPSALFLWVRRDPLSVARSIYAGRQRRWRELGLSLEDWWSVRPREFPQLKGRSIHDQIAGQIAYTERNIWEDAAIVGWDRILPIRYEALCQDPPDVVREIATFVRARGELLRARDATPDRFHVSSGTSQENASSELKAALARVEMVIPR